MGFGLFDAFLEFFLEGLLEEFSTFVEEKGFHGVEGVGITGNQVALIEEGVKLFREMVAKRGGRGGLHKYFLVKWDEEQ